MASKLIKATLLLAFILVVGLSPKPIPQFVAAQETAGVTHGPLVGAVTATSAIIWLRAVVADGTSIQARLSAVEDFSSGILVFPFNSSGPDHTWKAQASGLLPNTTYYVDVTINGEPKFSDPYPQFKTFVVPGQATNFKFVFLTDFATNKSSQISIPAPVDTFKNAAAENPDFVVIGGDFWHNNIDDMQGKREMFKKMYSLNSPLGYFDDFVRNLLPNNALIHFFDDHDMGKNNANKTYPKKGETLQVLQEFFPPYPMTKYGDWQNFSYGQVDFFVLDGRSQRDPNGEKDGPKKSILDGDNLGSVGQLQWLLNGLKSSSARWKIIFSPSPFNPTLEKRDAWFGFQHERSKIVDFIKSNNIGGVVIVSGDAHAGGIDDGTNADFPELFVPTPNAKNCFTSSSTGKWSHGVYGSAKKSKKTPPCPGYGVIQVLTNPDRVVLQVKNDKGEVKLEMTYALP